MICRDCLKMVKKESRFQVVCRDCFELIREKTKIKRRMNRLKCEV